MSIKDTKPIRKGQRITTKKLNADIGGRIKQIIAGPGILVRYQGAAIVIEATATNRLPGKRGTARWEPYSGA